MPLTGALQADFSDFVAESQKATKALDAMDAEAKKTGATLAKTGSSMDGFGKNTNSLTQLSTGLRAVDASANAMGVSLAKPILMIEEMGKVSGATYAQLGLLGTAGAVLGTAMAAWEFGKWASEWSGLNDAIQGVIYSLDLTGEKSEIAALNTEILAKASATAKRTITDLAEAREINYNAVKKGTAVVDTAIHRQALWEAEIRKHRELLPEITAALDNHTATVKQLEKQYGMSAEAITYYVAKTKDQAAAERESAAAGKAQLEAQKELTELRKGYGVQLMSINAETLKAVQADLELGAGQATVAKAYGLTAQQVAAASEQLKTNITITTGLGDEWANVGEKVKITADSVVADSKRMQDAAAAYQAETDRMVDEYTQGQNGVAVATDRATEATKQWTWQLNEAKGVALSVYQQLQAGMAVMEQYRKATIWTSESPIVGAYNFQRAVNAGVQTPTHSGDFGRALTVNVNSTEAQDIASKLVTEMRHQGVRF